MVATLLGFPIVPVPVRLRRLSTPPSYSLRQPTKPSQQPFTVSSAASSSAGDYRSTTMDFPYLSPAHRDLMLDLLSAVESSLGPQLLPSSVPADVLSFQNDSGNCKAALDIRLGDEGSKVELILESWLHCELPFGVLDITTLLAYLRTETDAPHLLMEFIQNGSDSLVLFIDLLPRRDLVLHADYLDHFYEQSPLEKIRQGLESAAEAAPYRSSSLYIRSALSPTAIALTVNCGSPGARTMEELMRELIGGAAREVVRVWLDRCALAEREVAEGDRPGLAARDDIMKKKTVEVDLAANLPRLYGPEIAARVVAEIEKAFGI